MSKKILIVDLETTGFDIKKNKIVEVGIVSLDLDTGDIEMLFDSVCHERPITLKEVESSWIVQNTSMTVEDIRNSPNLEDIKEEIQSILDAYPLGCTAYNNVFDFRYLDDRGFIFPKKLPCPMKSAVSVCNIPGKYGKPKWPNVNEAYKKLVSDDDGYVEIHRGGDDAYHEAQIVYELYKLGKFKI